jgi:hypothetical protein
LAEPLHATLEACTARVQHVANVIIQLGLFLWCPAIKVRSMRKRRVVRVC